MKDKLILFDWGNIVASHQTGYTCFDAWNDLFRECGYKEEKDVYQQIKKYRLTAIKTIEEYEEAYNQMVNEFNLNKSFEEYLNLYKMIFSQVDYYPVVADYELSLKDRCAIGVLSNLTLLDKFRIYEELKLEEYDYVFLSFELGMRKPDEEIFNYVQEKVSIEPNNILFIDDEAKNIEAASKFGWQTLQATGLELDKIKQRCDEFLN